jgi:glycerol-3-phosphate acyltransferase PlsY
MTPALQVACVAAGYLCGSIPFGVLLTRWVKGIDVRAQGSGNIGATNVARAAGGRLAVVVLVLDALKGALPILAVRSAVAGSVRLQVLVGLAAFLGHVFPVWLRFRGGKGVATALGVLCVMAPGAAAAGFGTYLVVLAATRVSALGSLLGGLVSVGAAFVLDGSEEVGWLATVLFVLMLWTHRANIHRLARRAERRL